MTRLVAGKMTAMVAATGTVTVTFMTAVPGAAAEVTETPPIMVPVLSMPSPTMVDSDADGDDGGTGGGNGDGTASIRHR